MTTVSQPTQTTVAPPAEPTFVKPRFRVLNTANSYSVQVELPGVKKENVSINLEKDVLSLRASRSNTVPADWKPLYRELREANYQLRLHLNVPVEESKLSAKLENGILTLSLPLRETAKPRTISVS
jgi:HSP20 family protein